MSCAALLWWLLLLANTSDGKFLNCSSEIFCPCNEVGRVCSERKVIPELLVCVPLTPKSCIFHCRDDFFIVLLGCEAGWCLWH